MWAAAYSAHNLVQVITHITAQEIGYLMPIESRFVILIEFTIQQDKTYFLWQLGIRHCIHVKVKGRRFLPLCLELQHSCMSCLDLSECKVCRQTFQKTHLQFISSYPLSFETRILLYLCFPDCFDQHFQHFSLFFTCHFTPLCTYKFTLCFILFQACLLRL